MSIDRIDSNKRTQPKNLASKLKYQELDKQKLAKPTKEKGVCCEK